jgi:NADPH2 dehydrogenase
MTALQRLGALKDVKRFGRHLASLGVALPCDEELRPGPDSPFGRAVERGSIRIGNRIAMQPMEGWDGETDGRPTERTLRRWRRFGQSGAKLIWGGEAVAVCHAGRANPNQLVIAPHTLAGLEGLRTALVSEHEKVAGSRDGLVVGLQLTHSGRYSRPNHKTVNEPKIAYHHPILDRRVGAADLAPLTDGEIQGIIEDFHRGARMARELGFDFVDVKHCHGYLGHELLGGHERPGRYGGSFENRTRFLSEVVAGIRSAAPGLGIGVRLSAFDTVPFRPDPARSTPAKPGPGIPEPLDGLLPYRWGFGVDRENPVEADLREAERFLALLESLGIALVNLTAGSPYYNPHLQRPAFYPPSDGYAPPEDPLFRVAQQIDATRRLKGKFPRLVIVGSAYSYLQEFLPHVAQALLREGAVDLVGLGRMALTYPELLWDAMEGKQVECKRICRTFSDCTTAPRKGLPSGCYPLDPYYKASDLARELAARKAAR